MFQTVTIRTLIVAFLLFVLVASYSTIKEMVKKFTIVTSFLLFDVLVLLL